MSILKTAPPKSRKWLWRIISLVILLFVIGATVVAVDVHSHNSNKNVRFLQSVWVGLEPEVQDGMRAKWASVAGDPELENAFLDGFMPGAGFVEERTGKPLTRGEARQFLKWILDN